MGSRRTESGAHSANPFHPIPLSISKYFCLFASIRGFQLERAKVSFSEIT
jgi:hypothetical protein